MTESKVAIEVAEQEFDRFCEEMDLDVDTSVMDAEDKAAFEKIERRLVNAIAEGRLTIDEKGQPVLQLSDGGQPVTFHEPNGANIIAMDQKRHGHNNARQILFIAEMTNQAEERIRKLPMRDLKICNSIVALFLD
jgi:hypothetical protein